MSRLHNLVVILITLSALTGCFLLIADLGERLQPDRLIVELALLAPLAVLLLHRRWRPHH